MIHHSDKIKLNVYVYDALEGHVHYRLLLLRLVSKDVNKFNCSELSTLSDYLHFLIGID